MKDDYFFMQLCENLGALAEEKGNPPVGAVIVRNGQVIAEAEEAGRSKNDITCHAEIEVIRKAIKTLGTNDLSDCILYSNHEPCVMCSYPIRFYKIKKVIYLHAVDYLGGATSSTPVLLTKDVPAHWSPPPEVIQLKSKTK